MPKSVELELGNITVGYDGKKFSFWTRGSSFKHSWPEAKWLAFRYALSCELCSGQQVDQATEALRALFAEENPAEVVS